MNDVRNGKVYAMLFFFFIVFLVVGGFFLTVMLTNDESKNKKDDPESKIHEEVAKDESKKIREDKDYIYFLNENIKSSNRDISYKEVAINIDSSDARTIENTINNEVGELEKTYLVLSDQNLSEEEQEKVIYKDDNIYKASYLRFDRYFARDYASLVSLKYDFDCFDGEEFVKAESYVIDINNGTILSNKDILDNYEVTMEDIKVKIRERLENKQTKIEKGEEEVEVILIDETLKALDKDENYTLFIDKGGFLNVTYLVKTIEQDYNDSIVID